MTPFFLHPLAFLALLSLPALAAIYLLHSRFRSRKVSGLFLWRGLARPREGGSVLRRLPFPPVILLEFLILLLLVAAALDLQLPRPGVGRRLYVVLDNSASMRAGDNFETPRERGEKIVLDEIARRKAGCRFILAGAEPSTSGTTVSDPAAARQILKNWDCLAPASGLERAAALALELAGEDGDVMVVTDKPPGEGHAGKGVRWIACGQAHANTALVSAGRTMEDRGDRCLVEVIHFGPEAVDVELAIDIQGLQPRSRKLSLQPGLSQHVRLNLPPKAGTVELSLPDDTLDIDNAVFLLPEEPREVAARISIDDKRLLKRVKKAADSTGMRMLRGRCDVLFTDSDSALRQDCWVVKFRKGSKSAALTGPFYVNQTHPLAKGLDLQGLIWGVGDTNALPGEPVILAGNMALVSVSEEREGNRTVTIRLRDELSNLTETPAWPALFWNIFSWRASMLPGLSHINVRCGMYAELSAPDAVKEAVVTGPGGSEFSLPVNDRKCLIPAVRPGLYRVDYGDRKSQFSAAFLSADESDLGNCVSGEWGTWRTAEVLDQNYVSAGWLFALVALGAGIIHLWVLTKKRGSQP
ncbi:MAG: vWA domain-containing protein [Verrucomicrobiota bacterium]